ncbi:hypothetical protein ACIQW5_10505 [Methylorubrum thiocyanatum]|uniref:hypothetical protein n=1 Tax=Methylorubrum thiocyanatum TaxID=47958 RepID=UPI003839F135
MTREEFETTLREVKPGQFADIPYETFADLFPPGVESDASKEAAYHFAKARGFVIENRPDRNAVWFVREA